MSTIEAASAAAPLEQQHATVRVLLISAAAALGGFLFGYDTAVINGATMRLCVTGRRTGQHPVSRTSNLLARTISGKNWPHER